jgi:hypothetical protein
MTSNIGERSDAQTLWLRAQFESGRAVLKEAVFLPFMYSGRYS